jgi:hypothetical protein
MFKQTFLFLSLNILNLDIQKSWRELDEILNTLDISRFKHFSTFTPSFAKVSMNSFILFFSANFFPISHYICLALDLLVLALDYHYWSYS